jgi:hypothetical protein
VDNDRGLMEEGGGSHLGGEKVPWQLRCGGTGMVASQARRCKDGGGSSRDALARSWGWRRWAKMGWGLPLGADAKWAGRWRVLVDMLGAKRA